MRNELPEEQQNKYASSWQVFCCAVMFLTRVPVPRIPDSLWRDAFTRCPLFFPLVGLLIGLTSCSVLWISLQCWPIPIAILVTLGFELLLTGAFHEDALADCFDAFGGGWEKDQILTIMKDSRIGTYGTLALLIGISLRGFLTWELVNRFENFPFLWILILITAATAGRVNAVWLMWGLPPVEQQEGLAKDISRQMSLSVAQRSTLIVSPVLLLFLYQFPLQALISLGGCLILLWCSIHFLKKNIGGVTGDCLGCLCYLTQLLVLLAAALLINLPMEVVS